MPTHVIYEQPIRYLLPPLLDPISPAPAPLHAIRCKHLVSEILEQGFAEELPTNTTPASTMNAKNLLASFFRNPAKYLLGGGSSKIYRALINNPVEVSVFENTLGEGVWTYDGTGGAKYTLSGAFAETKTFLSATCVQNGSLIYPYWNDSNSIALTVLGSTFQGQDNWTMYIEIRVYP